MDNSPIPGIAPHPNQIADQQRMADLRRSDPALAQAQQAPQKKASLMPDRTRDVLKKLADNMRQAAGLAPAAAPASVPPTPAGAAPPKPRPPEPRPRTTSPPERRAEVPDTSVRQPR